MGYTRNCRSPLLHMAKVFVTPRSSYNTKRTTHTSDLGLPCCCGVLPCGGSQLVLLDHLLQDLDAVVEPVLVLGLHLTAGHALQALQLGLALLHGLAGLPH